MLENTEGAMKKDNPEKLGPVSCVPYVTSFSKLSYFISPWVFSNIYCPVSFVPYDANFSEDTGQINIMEYRRGNEKGQSRETGHIGYTKHRTNKYYGIPKGQ
jgi:hypothetical protein